MRTIREILHGGVHSLIESKLKLCYQEVLISVLPWCGEGKRKKERKKEEKYQK
jgi:hypothetical protein